LMVPSAYSELFELIDKGNGRTELIIPHRTDVFWCERRGA
jgi:hypothetical protein